MPKTHEKISQHLSSQSKKATDAIAKVLKSKSAKKESEVKEGVNLVKLTSDLAKQKLENIRQDKQDEETSDDQTS